MRNFKQSFRSSCNISRNTEIVYTVFRYTNNVNQNYSSVFVPYVLIEDETGDNPDGNYTTNVTA